jgi:hypothetical protein
MVSSRDNRCPKLVQSYGKTHKVNLFRALTSLRRKYSSEWKFLEYSNGFQDLTMNKISDR